MKTYSEVVLDVKVELAQLVKVMKLFRRFRNWLKPARIKILGQNSLNQVPCIFARLDCTLAQFLSSCCKRRGQHRG